MNKNLTAIRKAVLDYNAALEQGEAAAIELKKQFDDGNISRNDYEAQLQAKTDTHEAKSKALQAIRQTTEAYENEVNEWASLNASDLTDDLKLFTSPIDLDAADYEALEKKYQCNYSMLKAIKDHARKNNAVYQSDYSINKVEKLGKLNGVITAGKNIIESTKMGSSMNYNAALWAKEEAFNNLYGETSLFIQTKEGSRRIVGSDGAISWG